MTVYEDDYGLGINMLPDELIVYILKFLPLESVLNCEKVCERWRKIVQDPLLWRHITIVYSGKPGQSEVSEKNLEIILTHSEYVRNLKIQYVYNYPVIKSVVERCSNLINLELVMCRVTKEFEDDLLRWPKLKRLNLKNSILHICNLDLIFQFDQFKDLTYLALSDFGLSSVNCDTLLQCRHLSQIFIEKIKGLELSFIKELILDKQKILTTLHIYGGDSIDDSCLKLLAKCPLLKDLAIIRCEQLTDEGLVSLEQLKYIEHLQLWNNNTFSDRILLKTLSNENIISLKSLSLSRIQNITPVIVDLISEYYKNLKFLALYQCPQIINTDYEKQLKSKFRNIDVVLY